MRRKIKASEVFVTHMQTLMSNGNSYKLALVAKDKFHGSETSEIIVGESKSWRSHKKYCTVADYQEALEDFLSNGYVIHFDEEAEPDA